MPHEDVDLGSSIQIRATFRKRIAGVLTLTTPTTTTIKIKLPDLTVTTINNASIDTESTGVKTHDYTTLQSGWHEYEVAGSGNMTAVKEGRFYVKPSLVP